MCVYNLAMLHAHIQHMYTPMECPPPINATTSKLVRPGNTCFMAAEVSSHPALCAKPVNVAVDGVRGLVGQSLRLKVSLWPNAI